MRSHLQSVIAARFRFMKAVDKENIAEVWKFLEALGHSDSLLWCNLIRWLDSRDLLAVLIFVFLMIYVFDLVQLKGCVGPKFAVLFNIRFSFWRYSAKQWLPTVCQNHLRSKLIFQRAFLVILILLFRLLLLHTHHQSLVQHFAGEAILFRRWKHLVIGRKWIELSGQNWTVDGGRLNLG